MFEPEAWKNETVVGEGDAISGDLTDEPMTENADSASEPTLETPITEPDPVEAAPVTEQEARPQESEESAAWEAPVSASEEPEPEDGEYHYKSGYTQRIYADDHYAPADESTVPPRYYTPPRRPSKVSPEKKPRKKGLFLKVACLCLVCALLGSVGGAALVGRTLNQRIAALEEAQEDRPSVVLGTETSGSTKKVSSTEISSGKPLAQLYEQACQQVVGITTEVTYQNFFGQTSTSAVSGSGFIISEDGYILTNYHVIEYADKGGYAISVMLHDGTRYEASIVGSEESNDIAVLKIDATGLNPVTLGNSDEIQVGDEVHPVGNPLGELEFSMTNGHVSALDRIITTETGGDAINMFQIDAPVNSGNSGGPVYNSEGEVIGIVTAKYQSSGVEGLGFAIPINDAVRIAEDLITKGYVTGKAYLGVTVETQYNAMYAQYYSMPLGAYIAGVEKNSCAEKAGLQAGDIITRVGDTQVESYNDLKQALKAYSAGDTAELEIYRADKSTTVTVVFDEARPSN